MKPCPEHKETLWLDIYGELNASAYPAWEKHLMTCEGCRQEREDLRGLIQAVHANMPSPSLSSEETRALSRSIARKACEQSRWRKWVPLQPLKLIPLLAVASVLIVALGWLGLKEFKSLSPVQTVAKSSSEEKLIMENLDIINNLELLEEMEALQKLVQLVDNPEYGDLSINGKMKDQGVNRYGERQV